MSTYAELLAQRRHINEQIAALDIDRELFRRSLVTGVTYTALAAEYGASISEIARRANRERKKMIAALRQLEDHGKPDEILRDMWFDYEAGSPDVTVRLP